MENSLSQRLQMAVRRITGRGKLTDKDIDEMMREVRLSLLEADVNFRVVRDFTARVKEQALGEKILKGLNPGQQVVKVVHDELKRIMGEENAPFTVALQWDETKEVLQCEVRLDEKAKTGDCIHIFADINDMRGEHSQYIDKQVMLGVRNR